MVTIKQIAERAGTSTATVSNVLNERPGTVSADKRRLIMETAEEMGYRLHRRARQLRKSANLSIAVQLDSDIAQDNRWRPTVLLNLLILQGISHYAYSRGYKVELIIPEPGRDFEELNKQVIKENSVDGIVFMGLLLEDKQLNGILSDLEECRLPAVTVDLRVYSKGIPAVSVDLSRGIRSAAERLKELGHSRACYFGTTDIVNRHERISRYQQFKGVFQSSGIELSDCLSTNTLTEIQAYRHTMQLIDKGNLPSVIVYGADHLAMAGLEAMEERGLRVPGDISVLSVDNAPYGVHSRVPLASIDQRFFDQGVTLARLLLDAIENKEQTISALTLVQSEFVERESLGRSNL